MKGIKMITIVFFALSAVLLPLQADEGADFELLLQKAYKYGNIRVILNLDVPDYQRLAGESARFRSGDLSAAARQGGFSADLRLGWVSKSAPKTAWGQRDS